MSTFANMQCLVGSAKPILTSTMRRLEGMLPKAGVVHYSLHTGDRELKVIVLAGSVKPVEVSHFSMSFLPGCRDVMILHGVVVEPSLRNMGVGALLHQCRLDIARAIGVKVVMCTVLSGNSAEKGIITRAGWRVALQVNPMVEMWSREL